MANFDPNQWYHIYYNQNKNTSMIGTQLFNRTTQAGATFFKIFNETQPAFQWQFYPLDNDFYALRTKASGADGFLGTKFSENEDTPGKTVPYMVRSNVSDDSAYWKIGPWKDGTFFLFNKANKTSYHLTRKGDSLAAMTSNISDSDPLPGQHFSFEKISAINDEQYSTVSLPSTTVTSAPTGRASGSPGNSNNSGGLSTGAKAGIGVGVALAVLILLVIGGLFLWKRHRRNKGSQAYAATEIDNYTTEAEGAPVALAHELPQTESVKYEANGIPTAELHSEARPAELAGEIPTVHNGR